MDRHIRLELRTQGATIPTQTVRVWTYYIRLEPPPRDCDSLEYWLQGLINRHPRQVPKHIILPYLMTVYNITT